MVQSIDWNIYIYISKRIQVEWVNGGGGGECKDSARLLRPLEESRTRVNNAGRCGTGQRGITAKRACGF